MFDPTRGSYSLGRVLLRRNTLYMIIGWWICNFKSILFNNLTVLTSITGPIIVPPGIAAKFLDCGCAWESVCSLQNGINCRQVEFCISSQLILCVWTMQVRKPLWIEFSRPAIRNHECFLASCFQMQVLEGCQKFYFLWFHTC